MAATPSPQPMDATDLARMIRERSLEAAAVLEACVGRIRALDGSLHAFHEVYESEARLAAAEVDQAAAKGRPLGPLAGVPIAVKDNIVTEWGRTTCGSRMLEQYRSPFTATALQRLIDAGAVVVGKTNCDEFAMGSSTEHCAWGPTRNPWDQSRIPGGSSGGSAVAVAAGMSWAALGSDTGGSVRQPASMCGVVGLKPSYGRVSRHGLIAYGSSLDQIGPITRSVRDAFLLLQIMSGADAHDATSLDAPAPDRIRIEDPTPLRIGVPRQYLSPHNDAAVNRAVRRAIEAFKARGAVIVAVDLPLTEYGVSTYYVIAPAEASSNLARFDGVRYGRRAAMGADDDLFDL